MTYSYFSALVIVQDFAVYFGIYEHKVSQNITSTNLCSVTCICQSMLFIAILLLPQQRGLQFKSQTPVSAYWRNDRICGYNR